MAEPQYRNYCFDSTGRLHETQWLHADSDETALATIEAKHPGSTCEVWRGERLVGRLKPVGEARRQ